MNVYLKKKATLRERKQRFTRFMVSATFRLGLLVFILAFTFLFVWQTNAVSTKGYVMSDLEQTIKELERENRKIEVEIAQHTSMESIEARLHGSNLVAVDHIEYLTPVGTAVAQR